MRFQCPPTNSATLLAKRDGSDNTSCSCALLNGSGTFSIPRPTTGASSRSNTSSAIIAAMDIVLPKPRIDRALVPQRFGSMACSAKVAAPDQLSRARAGTFLRWIFPRVTTPRPASLRWRKSTALQHISALTTLTWKFVVATSPSLGYRPALCQARLRFCTRHVPPRATRVRSRHLPAPSQDRARRDFRRHRRRRSA